MLRCSAVIEAPQSYMWDSDLPECVGKKYVFIQYIPRNGKVIFQINVAITD